MGVFIFHPYNKLYIKIRSIRGKVYLCSWTQRFPSTFAWLHCTSGSKVCHGGSAQWSRAAYPIVVKKGRGEGKGWGEDKGEERRGETEEDRGRQRGGREVSQNPL